MMDIALEYVSKNTFRTHTAVFFSSVSSFQRTRHRETPAIESGFLFLRSLFWLETDAGNP